MVEDAVKVAPHVYKVLLENDRVRVLEARLEAGGRTEMHSHPAQVVYALSGGKVKFTHPGGDSVEVEMSNGEVMFCEPARDGQRRRHRGPRPDGRAEVAGGQARGSNGPPAAARPYGALLVVPEFRS